MTGADARLLAGDGKRHVAAALRLVGHHEAGELPADLDIVEALVAHLVACGSTFERIEKAVP